MNVIRILTGMFDVWYVYSIKNSINKTFFLEFFKFKKHIMWGEKKLHYLRSYF